MFPMARVSLSVSLCLGFAFGGGGGGGAFKCYLTKWGWGYGSVQISGTKVHGPTLLALRGDGWVSNLQKKLLSTR